MNPCCIGELELGTPPRVVGTLSKHVSLPATHALADYACDIVEVRLDMLGQDTRDWLNECRAIEHAGFPVILTLRLAGEGGKWNDPDAAREPFLSSAIENLACVDVELTSTLRDSVIRQADKLGKPVIVSYHNFERTPDFGELREILDRILAFPCAVPKIATMVAGEEDVETLTRLFGVQRSRARCIIGMGSKGTRTRILFPSVGSCLAYGYLDDPIAPGQISSSELVQRLQQSIPVYRRDLISRKKLAGPA